VTVAVPACGDDGADGRTSVAQTSTTATTGASSGTTDATESDGTTGTQGTSGGAASSASTTAASTTAAATTDDSGATTSATTASSTTNASTSSATDSDGSTTSTASDGSTTGTGTGTGTSTGTGTDTDTDTDGVTTPPTELTVWTFDDPADRTAPLFGTASLSWWEQGGTFIDASSFGPASGFGLPTLGGQDVTVLRVPALGSRQGLRIAHNAAPNGVYAEDGKLSRYTVILDVFVTQESDGEYTALVQTDLANTSDAELFIDAAPSGGLGINGNYRGAVAPGQWHRLAWIVRAAPGEGQAHRMIDGTFVGGIGTTGSGLDVRFALDEGLLLLTDNDGETSPLYVASVGFAHEALTIEQIEAWGRPTAGGVHIAGEPGLDLPLTIRPEVLNFAHRGDTCCAPENTLVAIRQAFDKGADHIEIDVRVAADGTVVLFHDSTLDRTTEGTGAMSSRTVAQLKQLDAGSYFGPAFAGERVPTLAEALEEAKGRGRLYLDIKTPGVAMAQGIQAALDEAQVTADAVWIWADEAQIDSFYLPYVTAPKFLLRGSPTPNLQELMRLQAKGVEGFSFGQGSADSVAVQQAIPLCNQLGLLVEVFTILDPERMAELSDLGIGGMENDYPAVFERYQP
jgi:glycerophosphoryl diester phosphodiesterase